MKKGIYIWGTGKIASVFYECIDDNHLDGFVDNNAEKRGLLFNNKRIYSFDEIDLNDVIRIYNVTGHLIYNSTVNSLSDFNDLTSGIYVIVTHNEILKLCLLK